jgi:uncharacterized protein YbbC (DUF1343 family)
MQKSNSPYIPGIENFIQTGNKDLSYGLVTNDAATILSGEQSRLVLLLAGYKITKIFTPEHGIMRKGEDGKFVPNSIDTLTNIPIISLYGTKFAPSDEDLHDIDVVLFDVPDIGCRCYTYLWTLTHILEACAHTHTKVVVLDRANPLGPIADGPWLVEESCSSFIGRWSLPMVHGQSLGSLAQYFNLNKKIGCDLNVIDYFLAGTFDASYFVPTSPAISDLATACIYPGTVLFEGLNIDEGRGTGLDFRIFGAPWLDNNRIIENYGKNNGCYDLDAFDYISQNGQYKGQQCKGVKIKNNQHPDGKPFSEGCELIRAIHRVHADQLQPSKYVTLANPTGERHLDLLVGIPNALAAILNGEI